MYMQVVNYIMAFALFLHALFSHWALQVNNSLSQSECMHARSTNTSHIRDCTKYGLLTKHDSVKML